MSIRRTCAVFVMCLVLYAPNAHALDPDREEPHHVRMIAETAVYLLLGTAWYFSGQDLNAPDWDLEVTNDDLKKKFFGLSQIRFDNNTFLFNQAYHPFAHAGIYLTARSNDMGPYLAFFYTFMASLFWEYIGELREKVSVNDMIVSPLTGMAWGEVAHQYGEYSVSADSQGKWVHKVLTGFFGLPRRFHDWLDDESPTQFEERRFFVEPRASVVFGTRRLGPTYEPLSSFTIESDLALMPGYGSVGRDSQFFRDGNFSQFAFELQWSPEQIEVDIDATASVAGFYHRNIDKEGEGVEWMIGGGRGYRLISRDGNQFRDRVALAHILGPTLRLRLHGSNDFTVDVGLDLFFDFTAIRSLAVPKLVEAYGVEVLETTRTDIQKHAYYFGWGYTFTPTIAFNVRRVRLEAGTNISHVRSIQGIDRFEEDVTKVLRLNDVFWESKFALVIPTPLELLDVRGQWHLETHKSRLDEFTAERTYHELQLGVQSRF